MEEQKQKKVKMERQTAILAVALILAILAFGIALLTNFWIGLGIFSGTFGGFILQGLRNIPAKPPHKGQLTIWGKYLDGEFVDEGWNFFPFYPYWFGYVLVNTERITFDFTVPHVRTPDRSESEVPVSITLQPTGRLLTSVMSIYNCPPWFVSVK